MGTLYLIVVGLAVAAFVGGVLWLTRSGRDGFKPRDDSFWKDENVYLADIPDWMKEPGITEVKPEDDVDVDGKESYGAMEEQGRLK